MGDVASNKELFKGGDGSNHQSPLPVYCSGYGGKYSKHMESVLIKMMAIIVYSKLGDRAISRHLCRNTPLWRSRCMLSFTACSPSCAVSSGSSPRAASCSAASKPSVRTARNRLIITKEPMMTARYWKKSAQYLSAPSLRSYMVSVHPSIVMDWKIVAIAWTMLSKPLAPKLGLSVNEQKASATGLPPHRHCSSEYSEHVQVLSPFPAYPWPRRSVFSPSERQCDAFFPDLKACVSGSIASPQRGLHRNPVSLQVPSPLGVQH
mmetsp:Transcript_19546/g.53652  ORF Transcript_19546/g.53652 Transcript_19546/m.53652 type:complete len:263 (+) Transcript_19546:4507-5295(+)